MKRKEVPWENLKSGRENEGGNKAYITKIIFHFLKQRKEGFFCLWSDDIGLDS